MTYDIESVTNWDALCRVAHGMMRDKGWWEDGERPLHWMRLLIASEIAEAVECLRDGRIETWYQPTGKPEGFWVELADMLIRIADAVGAGVMECGCVGSVDYGMGDNFDLRLGLDTVLFDLVNDELSQCARTTFAMAVSHQHDLWATIREKLAYNATRPHKHGRKA